MKSSVFATFAVVALGASLAAQTVPVVDLPPSPRGLAAIQVGGTWATTPDGPQYRDGKWITVDYGSPVLRGRTGIFGAGTEYGNAVKGGAPVWRAGANNTTRLTTQATLDFGGKPLPPGVYNLLVDLRAGAWTLIFSNQPVQAEFNPDDTVNLSGAANYNPKFDVLRVPMTLDVAPVSFEQFTISFVDVTAGGGTLMLVWETTVAMAPFVAK